MINILTDSTADLSKDILEKYQISTIAMYIHLNGRNYKDGSEIQAQAMFDTVQRTGQYPTTSAPSPGDFMKFFNREEPTIYLGVSSKLSTTFRNAQLALEELDNRTIDLIDTLSISTGYGQVVLKAAEWRDEGMKFEELSQRLRDFITKTRGIFILDTLDYLYHGGRCSSIEHFVASMLKIHPFLKIRQDGTLGVLQKVRGERFRAVKALFSYFEEQLSISKISRIFITHLNCQDEADFLIERIQELGKPIEILTAQVGCVLATHSGPKPLGIAYAVE
jgi:DegV family protein with EDD domain